MATRYITVETQLGSLTITAHDDAITGIYFPHHWYLPTAGMLGEQLDVNDDSLLSTAATQLREYLAGERDRFDLPTAAHGDAFQESVWALLDTIPYGATLTYG